MQTLKKILALCLMSVCFVTSNFAQEKYVGIIGGLNFADLSAKVENGRDQLTSTKTLYSFGGLFGFGLNESITIEFEPMFLQKGGETKAHDSKPDISFKMSYLEVPVFLKVSFGKTLRAHLSAGPTFGYLLKSDVETEAGVVTAGEKGKIYKADLKEVTESLNIGFSLGTGFSYPIGSANIFFDGRYTFGFSDIIKEGSIEWKSADETYTAEVGKDEVISTKGFQIMMGVVFPLSK